MKTVGVGPVETLDLKSMGEGLTLGEGGVERESIGAIRYLWGSGS